MATFPDLLGTETTSARTVPDIAAPGASRADSADQASSHRPTRRSDRCPHPLLTPRPRANPPGTQQGSEGAPVERIPDDPTDLVLLDEESVVAEVGHDVRPVRGRESGVQLVGQAWRVEAVGVDRDDRAVGADASQGRLHAASVAPDVVGVHGLGQHHVGVRVEATSQLARVVVEVGLDGEATAVTGAQRVLAELRGATEAFVELALRAVGDVGDATRETEAR